MKRNEIWLAIDKELRSAKNKHPIWPEHPAAQAGVVVEEAGELMRACMKWKYERASDKNIKEYQKNAMKEEAIQTAVTAIRFLENLK